MFSIAGQHIRERGKVRIMLTAPVIYGMIIPIVFIDLCATLYQAVCFRAYGVARVPRKKYIRLVKRGKNLPWNDRFNCTYCSYANGVAAYVRAVLIETEKYWCPIKYHLRQNSTYHPPHPQRNYAEDGNIKELEQILPK